MSFSTSLPHAFGLHITDSALKIALIQSRFGLWSKPLPVLRIALTHELPAGIVSNGEIKNRQEFINELRTLLLKSRIKKINNNIGVVANLPETKTFLKYVCFTEKAKEDLDKFINKYASNEIPLPQEDLSLDYQTFEERGSVASAILCAAPKSTVNDFTSVFEEMGLTIFALEVESLAIARAVLPPLNTDEIKKTEMIIDIGSERTSAIFATGGVPRLTVLVPFSGAMFTKKLAESLKIDFKKAEEFKIHCGLNLKKCDGATQGMVNATISEFMTSLKSAIKFYHSQFLDAPKVGSIHLSGGGAYLQRLDSIVSKELRIKARKADLLSKISLPSDMDQESILHYTTAVGLSLRGALAPFPEYE